MKRKLSLLILLIFTILCLLVLTKPSNADYNIYLNERHGIICGSLEEFYNCVVLQDEQMGKLSWSSKGEKDVGIFVIIKDTYRDEDGSKVTFKSMGILGKFYDLE